MNRKRAAIAIIAVAGIAFLYGALVPPVLGSENPDRSIILQNDRDQNVTVTMTIQHQSSEIHQETLTITAHSKIEGAELSANLLHVGQQSVTVTVTDSGGGSASLQLPITDCYGPAYFFYKPDGKLETVPYSVAC